MDRERRRGVERRRVSWGRDVVLERDCVGGVQGRLERGIRGIRVGQEKIVSRDALNRTSVRVGSYGGEKQGEII
jgi:hypothetical protein